MGEYIEKTIASTTKIEATIGLGITTIIMTYVLQNTVNGATMPNWAMMVLFALLAVFFGIRVLAYFRFIVEREMYFKEQRMVSELKVNEMLTQIKLLEAQTRLVDLQNLNAKLGAGASINTTSPTAPAATPATVATTTGG